MQRDRLPLVLIPVAALIAIVPLLLQGCSCGHDFDFHLLSWMEAARQFAHGNFHPQWAYSAAYNAGEPRFVFYPPMSWTLGAILGLVFPWTWTPVLYTWLALTACGFAMHRLVRGLTTPVAAVLAAVVYTVNPYMLFTAYERTAYAELLAAAWIPLLLHGALRRQVTIPRIAIPVALLWLTNAPAAVMLCYALGLIVAFRIIKPYGSSRGEAAFKASAGTLLGLALGAFYIVPAAYERRYVQIAMAIIPNMRVQDNFLFGHTGDAAHDQVLHTASVTAVILLALLVIALVKAYLVNRERMRSWAEGRGLLALLALLAAVVALMLTPLTAAIWRHAPELAFLQFPWRLLALLAALFGVALAMALVSLDLRSGWAGGLAILLAAALVFPAYFVFRQSCDEEDTVSAREALFRSAKGAEPTDEYTPTTADNDSLGTSDPGFWLATDPDAKAPANAQSGPAPMSLTVNAPRSEELILNLRDYPGWRVKVNGSLVTGREAREDGLIAVPVAAGSSTIVITYARMFDQIIGEAISVIALVILIVLVRRRSLARNFV
jgi:hypothetical protein